MVPRDSVAICKNKYKDKYPKGLKEGQNKILITVTAENKDKRVYTLIVTLLKPDFTFKTFKIDGKDFEVKDTMTYETYEKELKLDIVAND